MLLALVLTFIPTSHNTHSLPYLDGMYNIYELLHNPDLAKSISSFAKGRFYVVCSLHVQKRTFFASARKSTFAIQCGVIQQYLWYRDVRLLRKSVTRCHNSNYVFDFRMARLL